MLKNRKVILLFLFHTFVNHIRSYLKKNRGIVKKKNSRLSIYHRVLKYFVEKINLKALCYYSRGGNVVFL